MNDAAKAAANQAEIDFGLERAGEAQLALRYLLGHGANEPYRGSFDVAGAPLIEVFDHQYLGKLYGDALKEFCVREGAVVGLWTTGEDGLSYEPGKDGQGVQASPADVVRLAARIPPNFQAPRNEVLCGSIVACAEAMRVLLAGAISAAKEDARPGEQVKCMFRLEPRFRTEANLKTGVMAAGGELEVNIFTETEPRVSYILGSKLGEPPRRIQYMLPLVELFYGPNRLRWMDHRAPDAQRAIVVGGR